MEHPMPVGKTFPTNPSTPQKEARSFSIKDEKTTIIPSSDEMPPAGKADYDSAQNNQDKENRQSDRPTGNVRHQTFFPHSRKPEKKKKVFLVFRPRLSLIYSNFLLSSICSFTFQFIQNYFTHTHTFWSYFYIFVFFDIFQCFFQ